MTQRVLAARSGTHPSHISRMEAGDGRQPSRALLDRLASALGDPRNAAGLASAAGRLTGTAERAVSPFPLALSEPLLSRRAVPALRRIDMGPLADAVLRRVPNGGLSGGRVIPENVLRTLRLRPEARAGDPDPAVEFVGDRVVVRDAGRPDDAGAVPRIRFLLAHAAAHAWLGERSCTFPRAADGELPAIDLAAHLLAPREPLERALADVSSGLDEDARSSWSSASAAIAAAVADRLAVPGWVAIRRLADEALLDDDALTYAHGGRS